MASANLTYGLALVAGIASFLSPCVLSLVPVYITYLGGRAVTAGGAELPANRAQTFLHGVAFVLGFSFVFVSLGAAASALGQVLFDMRDVLTKAGGVVVIVLGLHTMGVVRIPFLYRDTRPQYAHAAQGLNFATSGLMGIFFAAGWSPCLGPILGAIMTLAFSAESAQRGTLLLCAYSAGLGLPFLAAALAVGRVSQLIRSMGRYMRYIELANGVLLIVIGGLLFTGALSLITIQLSQLPTLLMLQERIDGGLLNIWGAWRGG
jgi:cytochrome c-type biogenesis protein